MFEFESAIYWRAKSTSEHGWPECQGKLKIFEFNQEDDELSTEVQCQDTTDFADGVKRCLRTKITEKLLEEALKLVPAMKAKDVDEGKLARAKAEAKAAEEGFKEATEKSGAEKQAIAAAQKLKEEEMKKEEQAKNVPLKPSQVN